MNKQNTIINKSVRNIIREFVDLFKDMPNRASGNYLEQKSAMCIKNFTESMFECRTVSNPFAVDLSSGSWNTALHSIVYFVLSAAIILVGLLSRWLAGSTDTRQMVELGFFGDIPIISLIACLTVCALITISRFTATFRGWSFFSFIVPNAESENIICLSRKDKKKRKNLIVFVAHYDSARSLPPFAKRKSGYKILTKLTKNGLALYPTIAMIAFCLILIYFLIQVPIPVVPWVSIVLAIFALIIILVEGFIGNHSANLPYNPGFNDNMSGTSVLIGLMSSILLKEKPLQPWYISDKLFKQMPKAKGKDSGEFKNSDFAFVFTGSEENGLRGAVEFRKHEFTTMLKEYKEQNVYVINLDSVSGKKNKLYDREIDFAGRKRGGNKDFFNCCIKLIGKQEYIKADLMKFFSDKEIDVYFKKSPPNRYIPKLYGSDDPIPACTDMSALCRSGDKTLNIVTIVSRKINEVTGILMPRDYHSLSDTYEKMVVRDNGKYMSPIYFLTFVLHYLAQQLDSRPSDA